MSKERLAGEISRAFFSPVDWLLQAIQAKALATIARGGTVLADHMPTLDGRSVKTG
ncbi:hypothetical protein [Alcanivorax sp.]|jgi:hypothetical protein|uniref:hypothetical protein n=1 Tax=Alcanivorax sp. TaxID=1872427 RepID=UPI00198ABEEE|nr:hypothetical protein [Alcanivorax sp.]MBD3644487.1 hypothetical protein [Alcanivorax sp.]